MLKAEVAHHPELDINRVEKIVDLLKHHPKHLSELYNDQFSNFRSILSGESALKLKTAKFDQYQITEGFDQFIETYFEEDILKFAESCLKTHNYRGLYEITAYAPVFSAGLVDKIGEKLTIKISYCQQCIEIGVENLEEKIEPVCNLFFFRSLNQLSNPNYEDQVTDLLNTVVLRAEKNLFLYRVLYAMAEFKAIGTEMKQTLKNNKEVAIDRGVSTTFPVKNNKENRGETFRKKTWSITIGKWSVSPLWLILVVIFLFARFKKCERSMNSTNFRTETSVIKDSAFANNNVVKYPDKAPKSKTMADESDALILLREKIIQVQSLKKNIRTEPSAFEIDGNYFKIPVYSGHKTKHIINRSMFDVILLLNNSRDQGAIFIESGESISTNYVILGFSLYAGNDFEKVEYMSSNDSLITAYRFKSFGEINQVNLNQFYKPELIFEKDVQIVITSRDGKLKVEQNRL